MNLLNELKTKTHNLLSKIDNIWIAGGVVIAIFVAGFKCGSYHTETKMMREQIKDEETQREIWIEKEDSYRKEIQELRVQIISIQTKLQGIMIKNISDE